MVGAVALGLGLVVLSGLLLAVHLRAWRQADHGGLSDQDERFHRRQFRRRMQASGMLGVIGLLMLGDSWIERPLTAAIYWSGVATLVLWTALLALSDWLATRLHYESVSAAQVTEHTLLKAEIEQYRQEEARGNEDAAEDR